MHKCACEVRLIAHYFNLHLILLVRCGTLDLLARLPLSARTLEVTESKISNRANMARGRWISHYYLTTRTMSEVSSVVGCQQMEQLNASNSW